MLMFKKKFLEDIRSGKKTQTLRCWKWSHFRTGQKSFIPGVGPVRITLVEEVRLEDLTDEDAIPDGFPTIESLRRELAAIYGDPLPGKMFRIRFCLEPDEKKDEKKRGKSTEAEQSVSSAESESASAEPSVKTKKDGELKKNGLSKNAGNAVTKADVASSSMESSVTEPAMNGGLQLHPIQRTAEVQPTASEPVGAEKKPVLLTEEEIADKLMIRCRIHRNSCDWNHEPGKTLDFFALFLKSPRNEAGIPTLDGYRLQSLMRQRSTAEEWEEIGWLASDVCRSWTEWQFAVERWNAASSRELG